MRKTNAENLLNSDPIERPRTSTAIAREYQYLKQKIENDTEV